MKILSLLIILLAINSAALANEPLTNYLQLHPAYPEIDGVLVDDILKDPIPLPVKIKPKNIFQRHPVATKSSSLAFSIHLLIWALEHMYVPTGGDKH